MSNYTPSVGAISCGMLPLTEELPLAEEYPTECSAFMSATAETRIAPTTYGGSA